MNMDVLSLARPSWTDMSYKNLSHVAHPPGLASPQFNVILSSSISRLGVDSTAAIHTDLLGTPLVISPGSLADLSSFYECGIASLKSNILTKVQVHPRGSTA